MKDMSIPKSELQNYVGRDFISMSTRIKLDIKNVSTVPVTIVKSVRSQVVNNTCKTSFRDSPTNPPTNKTFINETNIIGQLENTEVMHQIDMKNL